MKTFMRSILLVGLLLTAATASAQKVITQDLETWMSSLLSEAIDNKIEVCKSLGQERDILQEGSPLKWRYDTYTFTLPKKKRFLLDEMIKAFEANGHHNPNCYGINSLSESSNGNAHDALRNLMIGYDMNRYVTIGKDYENYININILDAADTTKSHRYAYALEWSEKGKATDVRYIVTYAKIPSATTTIIQQNWPYIELGRSRIRRDGPIQAENKARAYYLGKEYDILSLDSLIREAQQKEKETYNIIDKALQREAEVSDKLQKFFVKGKTVVAWNDSLYHETDPVTDVVSRLHQGQPITSDDLLCNDNILLIFSQLKQQFLSGQNTEFNAISIYSLCKRAHEYGFFTNPRSKAELDQLKNEVITIYNKTEDKTCAHYLQMAFDELEKIQQTDNTP